MDVLAHGLDVLSVVGMVDGALSVVMGAARTVCGPAWHSDGFHEAHTKIYHVLAGAGEYDVGSGFEALRTGRVYLIAGARRQRYRCARRMTVAWCHLRVVDADLAPVLGRVRSLRSWPARSVGSGMRWLARVAEAAAGRDSAAALGLTALAAELLARVMASDDSAADPIGDPRLAVAADFLAREAVRHPSLAAAARVAGLHPVHFHRRFTAQFGVTPSAYALRERLQRARRLLAVGELPVNAISLACGYADPFHFSRVFRQHHGASPCHWRGRGAHP